MRLNLNSTYRGSSALLMAISSFVNWWLRELQSLVPWAVNRKESRSVVVNIDLIDECISSADDQIAKTSQDGPWPTAPAHIADLARDALPDGVKATGVAVRHSDIMEATVSVPSAARNNLSEFLDYELDRYIPIPVDDIVRVYDYQGFDKVQSEANVILTVCRKETLDFAEKIAAQLRCDLIYLGKDLSNKREGNLASNATTQALNRHTGWKIGLLAFILCSAMTILHVSTGNQRQLLQQQLADLQSDSRSASSAKLEIENRLSWMTTIAEEQPQVLDALAVVVDAIGPSGTINYLAWKPDGYELAGRTPDTASMIQAITLRTQIDSIEYLSPIEVAPDGTHERFHVKISLAEHAEMRDAVE